MSIGLTQSATNTVVIGRTIQIKGSDIYRQNGKIAADSGRTYRTGDWVKYVAADNNWIAISVTEATTGTNLTADPKIPIGVIESFFDEDGDRKVTTEELVTSGFNYALIYTGSGNSRIRAKDTFLWDGSARVAYAPETHVKLSTRLLTIPSQSIKGGETDYFFSFGG